MVIIKNTRWDVTQITELERLMFFKALKYSIDTP
jgi:hypothetical protein